MSLKGVVRTPEGHLERENMKKKKSGKVLRPGGYWTVLNDRGNSSLLPKLYIDLVRLILLLN